MPWTCKKNNPVSLKEDPKQNRTIPKGIRANCKWSTLASRCEMESLNFKNKKTQCVRIFEVFAKETGTHYRVVNWLCPSKRMPILKKSNPISTKKEKPIIQTRGPERIANGIPCRCKEIDQISQRGDPKQKQAILNF